MAAWSPKRSVPFCSNRCYLFADNGEKVTVGLSSKVSLASRILTLIVVGANGAAAQSDNASVQADIKAWESANRICRGVSDPDVYGPACDLREQLGRRLASASFCGGEAGWSPCDPSESASETATRNSDLQEYLITAGALVTVCKQGIIKEQESDAAESLCVGRLQGAANIMQYNCISLQSGAQPAPVLTMGDFPDGSALVTAFLSYMAANPQEAETEWSYVALNVFSASFPCR